MISPLNKIQNSHLQRTAYIYVRQSSEIQVQQHQESTRRQYELQQRAAQLGWRLSQIKVIDVDLGNSASDPQIVRPGFEQLVTEVALGQVGAIFSLEVSRLARQDSQWHRLIELASVAGVLLIDEQQVYDPRLADDRLMLGLKGLLSSNELRQMHLRLWENKLHKAQRGQLH
ncbi:MAG TPA: recombinase family protein, partial [Anaerolineae bacterium]|nr:recombinase family protein [Anaerolineae bacterium]